MGESKLLKEVKLEFASLKPYMKLDGYQEVKELVKKAMDDINKNELDNAINILKDANKIATIEEQKQKARSSLNSLEDNFEDIEKLSLTIPEINELNNAFENENYTFVIEEAEKLENEIKSIVDNSKPSLIPNLQTNDFKLGGKKTQMILVNEGDTPAKNISIELAGDIKCRLLSEPDIVNSHESKPVDVYIKPDSEGDIPLEISLNYTDGLNRNYEYKDQIWINVGDNNQSISTHPQFQEVSPAQFSPPSHTTSFPQEIVHRYSDPQFIGKGGFARVFRTQRDDGRIVAVKVPLSLDESTGKSFIREISVWQRLSHENIVSLYDMNVVPLPYLELEYADGGSLDSLKKPMDVEDVSKIMFNIADGIKHAHEQGVAHRDLKPQNILLTGDMTPKITDWGLSKVIAESKTSSRFGYTPLYAAPEQISPKKFGRPDFRTDIYQLGVIFYELATGKLPFEGDDFSEIGFAIINDKPEKPSSLNPECNKLDKIILKCLKKKPDERYQNISDMQQDLAKYLKVEYTKSLAKSAGNLKRSCIYCGDLVLLHAKLGNVEDALKFAVDMKNYSQDGVSDELEDIVNQMDYLAGRKQSIGDELMTKIGVVLHQVKMGR